MALNIKKWNLETTLEFINSGNGTMEIYAALAADETKKGTLIIVGSNTSKFVTVKEFLPSGIDEPWKLNDEELLIQALNVGTEDACFNIMEEGPFRKPEIEPEYPSEAHKIMAQYNNALMETDKFTMKLLINKPIPNEYKKDKNLYSLVCHARAKICCILNKLDEADTYYDEGWKYYKDSDRWYYCMDWADMLINKINAKGNTEIGKTIEKAISILESAKLHNKNMPFEKYNSMAIEGMKAFCICYLGETEQAKSIFTSFDFNPISADDFTDPSLHFFFSKISYSFLVAIELRDVELLRNLSSIISTGRPELLLEPSVQLCMRRAFGNVNENGLDEINIAFGNFINSRSNYVSNFPNLGEFLEYINIGDDNGMNRYFGFVG